MSIAKETLKSTVVVVLEGDAMKNGKKGVKKNQARPNCEKRIGRSFEKRRKLTRSTSEKSAHEYTKSRCI